MESKITNNKKEVRKYCPLCGGQKILDIRNNHGFTLSYCVLCKFMFVKEIFNYEDYYNSDYFYNYDNSEALYDKSKSLKDGSCSYEKNRAINTYEGGFRALKKFVNFKGISFLDVGCAEGYGMELAKGFGSEIFGMDVSVDAIEKCKKRGLNRVFVGELFSCPLRKIEAATMIDVLEHMQDPKKSLKSLNSIMSMEGVVYVKNNLFSLKEFLENDNYFFRQFEPPYHCSYFSGENMIKLFKENGFDLIYRKPRIIFYLFEIYAFLKRFFSKRQKKMYNENKKKRLSKDLNKKFSGGSFLGRYISEIFPSGFVFRKNREIKQ